MIVGFSFSQCLRYAFFAGAGYADFAKVSDEDQDRWVAFEPPKTGCFASMSEHFVAYAELQDDRSALLDALKGCVERLEWLDDRQGTEQPWARPARAVLEAVERRNKT